MAETSKASVNGPFPPQLNGWNWGAFLLNWIWGIGNHVWIALIALVAGFIPFVGPIIVLATMIYLGLKGNELAWKNRKFDNIEQFKAVQKAWMMWGIILTVIGIILSIVFASLFLRLASTILHTSKGVNSLAIPTTTDMVTPAPTTTDVTTPTTDTTPPATQ